MTDEAKVAETETDAVESSEQSSPDLTVQDLTALKQIIDVASQRGAFKPGEMAVVGTTYNRLEAFLGAIQSQQAQAESQGE